MRGKDSIVYQINPCRYCNSTNAVELGVKFLDIDKALYWVSCARCGRETKVYDKKRNAFKEWNMNNKLNAVGE